MGFTDRHDEKDCECVKYKPFIRSGEIRLNGINLLCRKCNRYVDPAKRKGGILNPLSGGRIFCSLHSVAKIPGSQ